MRTQTIAFALTASLFSTAAAPLGAAAQPQQPAPATSAQPQQPGAAQQQQPAPASSAQPQQQGVGLPPPPPPPVLPPVPAQLQQQFSAPVNAAPNPDLVGVNQMPFVGMSLQTAIGMALQRNTDLALSQANRQISAYQIIAAKGAYDVNFQLVPSYVHTVMPVITPFNATSTGGPVTQDTAGVTTALRGLTGSGGNYSVGVNASRVTNNSAFNSYNPYYQTALQFAVTQPLARGLAIDQARLQLRLANVNSALQASNALVQASTSLVTVQDTYYDLVNAWQNVAIQEQGLEQATAQAESNRRLAARGALAPTDIVEANTQVNVFQDNIFAAIQNLQRVGNQLKSLILANPADPVWFANLVPTTPIAQVPQEPSLDALITSAIQNRPEIAQVRAQREQANLNLAFAKDQLKPQVDLGVGYTQNGFAGNPLNPAANPLFGLLGPFLPPGALTAFAPPAFQSGNVGTAFKNGFNSRFPTYSAQLTYTLPIGNRTGHANYAIAQQQQADVSINETAVLQRIRAEAVNAIQGLREAQYRVIAARAAREAAERVLLGEQRRFQAGTSTTFLVLQRQLNVATQRGRELQAQTDLDKAIVELQRVSGGIFAQNGVDVNTLGTETLRNATMTSVFPPPVPTSGTRSLPQPERRAPMPGGSASPLPR